MSEAMLTTRGCARLSSRSVGGLAAGAPERAGERGETKTRKRAQGPGAHENRHRPSAREGVTDVTVV